MKYSTFVAAQLLSSAAALKLVPREVRLVLAFPRNAAKRILPFGRFTRDSQHSYPCLTVY